MYFVDLNSDLGEGAAFDSQIIPLITSANIACGFHAGDSNIMNTTVALCKENSVAFGAHPGYLDKENFGRTNMTLSPEEVYNITLCQLGSLSAFAKAQGVKMQHVKPHGAMYNMAAKAVQEQGESISDETINALNKTLTTASGKINAVTDKKSANDIYQEYYKEINSLLGIKDYTIEEIKVKETRQRYTADILVERDGEEVMLNDVQFFTYTTKDDDEPKMSMDFYVEQMDKTVGSVISQTFKQTISTCKMVYASLGGLLTGKFGFKDLSGPVGIASAVTEVASESLQTGFLDAVNSIIYVMMIITVNLGLFNMLPFPALDGGRFVFLLIEAIRRKPVPRKAEAVVNSIGMALLILLTVVITVSDVFKLVG